MVRKLKALAGSRGDGKLAQTVRDSAQQIWLAGLGAFSKAQAEGGKVFGALVKEGQTIQAKTRKVAGAKMDEMTSTLGRMATKATSQATGNWDKLEQVFEERVARALNRIGVPTDKDIQNLAKRVEELTASVKKLDGGTARKPAKRKAAAARRSAGAAHRARA
jgi:poly(hydroxyalkanoate) granule-associated protein